MGRFRFTRIASLILFIMATGCESTPEDDSEALSSDAKVVPGCESDGSAEIYNPHCTNPTPSPSPTPEVSPTPTPTPTPAQSATLFEEFATRGASSCGITTEGELLCWGLILGSQPDNGANGFILQSSPISPDADVTYRKIAVGNLGGYPHWCGITTDGTLKCWGSNHYGQVGDGTLENRQSPTEVDHGVLYKEIAVGGDGSTGHSCGITTSGALKCWGVGGFGWSVGIGDGSTAIRPTPTLIDAGVSYVSISVGNESFCGITSAGVLKCWGRNFGYYTLGDGTNTNRNVPTVIDAGTKYKFVSTAYTMTCGVTEGGVLKCWGTGYINGTWGYYSSPLVVGTDFKEVAVGGAHVCALKMSGNLECWGNYSYGVFGSGGTVIQTTPLLIDSGVTYSKIYAGSNVSCGKTSLGDMKCWGGEYPRAPTPLSF